MPIPDIDQGYSKPTDLPWPSDGPCAEERHQNADFRRRVAQEKIKASNEPKKVVPGSGPAGRQ